LVTVLNKTLLNFATNTVQPFTVRAVDNILNTFDRPFNVTVTATNNRPSITSMPNYVRMAGATLTVATPASDPDVPPQPFTFTLLTAPTGATVNASSGLISWHPLIGLGGATSNYTFRVKVDDNGAPNLSATQTFAVTVFQPTQPPTVDGISTSGGQFALLVSGEAGPDYTLAASTNLVQWTPLFITNPAALPVWLADPATTTNARRFYRVIMGPWRIQPLTSGALRFRLCAMKTRGSPAQRSVRAGARKANSCYHSKDNMGWSGWEEFRNLTPNDETNLQEQN
jgi:hypothetical protein